MDRRWVGNRGGLEQGRARWISSTDRYNEERNYQVAGTRNSAVLDMKQKSDMYNSKKEQRGSWKLVSTKKASVCILDIDVAGKWIGFACH